jgi:hypothetical protein
MDTRVLLRSFKRITKTDLERLRRIAEQDREDLFRRKPALGRLYGSRLLCVALCQGAALHCVDQSVGIKDFDVWSFYREHRDKPFPYRRISRRDFGAQKFGTTPGRRDFKGRCVDLIGRSIAFRRGQMPLDAVLEYLLTAQTHSAKLLREKAVVVLEPQDRLGEILWSRHGDGLYA